jgi:hypothetical protein
MRIGCIQSVIDSQAFAPTALDYLLDRPSPVRLMRRGPTASYSPWALQIAISKRFELTARQYRRLRIKDPPHVQRMRRVHCESRLDERQQIGVDGVRLGRGHTVWESLVGL